VRLERLAEVASRLLSGAKCPSEVDLEEALPFT
jgi:hypothetical protein